MTTYTWTDNTMRSGSTCDVDKVADNLMHLKYNAGGLLPVNDLGTKTSNFTLEPNKIDMADITAALIISLPTTGLISGVENKCVLNFTTTSTSSPTLPSDLKWSKSNGGVAPSAYQTTSGVRNVLTFTTVDGGTTWHAEYNAFGIVLVDWTQPTLTANGTLGSGTFAVAASSEYRPAWYAVNKNSSDWWTSNSVTTADYILWSSTPLLLSGIAVTNRSDMGNTAPNSFALYGSNDNTTYTLIGNYTNSNSTAGATWTQAVSTSNFYKYFKMHINSVFSGVQIDFAEIALTAKYVQS